MKFSAGDLRLLTLALHNAIDWQDGLADAYAHVPKSPERKEAHAQIKQYRRLLAKISGNSKTPIEQDMERMTSVPVTDILKQMLHQERCRNRPGVVCLQPHICSKLRTGCNWFEPEEESNAEKDRPE